jgi:hypothetical protein
LAKISKKTFAKELKIVATRLPFINEGFFDEQSWTRVFVEAYTEYVADGLFTSRRRKPAENAAHREKSHLWMKNSP